MNSIQAQTPKYTVKQTAEMTGLSLNQVRLWERRYSLVSPQRAENGYRMYSQNDLDILNYVLKQSNKGVKMNVLANQVKKSRDAILKQLRKTVGLAHYIKKHHSKIPNYDLLINAIVMDNPYKFSQLLQQAQAGRTFIDAVRHIDLPILAKLGDMSMAGKIPMRGPLLAAAVIKDRMLTHIEQMEWANTTAPIMLANATNDYHEIGLIFAWMELTANNESTSYIGSLPPEELLKAVQQEKPKALMISMCSPMGQEERKAYFGFLAKEILPLTPLALGGYEASKYANEIIAHGLEYFESIDEALSWAMDFNVQEQAA